MQDAKRAVGLFLFVSRAVMMMLAAAEKELGWQGPIVDVDILSLPHNHTVNTQPSPCDEFQATIKSKDGPEPVVLVTSIGY
ncbi:hypothetical protein V8C42DRAFT_320344 [Trichoderma barbatum]